MGLTTGKELQLWAQKVRRGEKTARKGVLRCTNLPRWEEAERGGREAILRVRQKEKRVEDQEMVPCSDSQCQENKTKTEGTPGQQ